MDWAGIKRRLVIAGALITGAVIGQGKEAAGLVKDVIKAEQEAKRRKKDSDAEGRRKRKEGEGSGGEPPKDPPNGPPDEQS